MSRRVVVALTEPQARALLGAVGHAEVYLEDVRDTLGLYPDEARSLRVLRNAEVALRAALHGPSSSPVDTADGGP